MKNKERDDVAFLNNDIDGGTTVDLGLDNEQNQPLPGTNADDFDKMLDDFINSQLEDVQFEQAELAEDKANNKPPKEELYLDDDVENELYDEERSLYEAYCNFKDAVINLGEKSGVEIPEFKVKARNLYTRFKPERGRQFAEDVIKGWDTMLLAQPTRLSTLKSGASDEEILEFAEKTTDETLQLALISYVEILIEMEGCEIAYNMRKVKAKKRRIEKEIYEEHQRRKEKIKKYVEAIRKEKLPVDAERLVTNYFKTAKKDPDGAYKVLTNNPATFAPIEIDKIPPRFFGMIKPKPEDGKKWNKIIAKFMKQLKA